MSYRMIRVFCATPGDLEEERRLFYGAAAEVNERESRSREALLVPISVEPRMANKSVFQAAVDANVRTCSFFVQVLADTWGPPTRNFRREFDLARECGAGIVVFFKGMPGGTPIEPDVAALKQQLQSDPAVRCFEFADLAGFREQLTAVLSGWIAT